MGRTVTSTTRLLEALTVFRSDFRVQVVFAVNETSPFNDGVEDLLRSVGAKIIPWEQIGGISFDLAVTASENVDFEPIDAPILVLPHGVGFHRYVPSADGKGTRLSGLVQPGLLRSKQILMAVTHPEQTTQLEAESPGTGEYTVLIRDPTYERLLASARLRDYYRRSLGVDDDRRLVVLTSTWRRQSLLGRWRDVLSRCLAELPADKYQIAAILHPNIWYGHGARQVRAWLADALDAGLALTPPDAGWPAMLIAADVVIGDHGSVTFYAAALGVPVLQAAFGSEAVEDTANTRLAATARRFHPDQSLQAQLDDAEAGHGMDRLAAVASGAFVTQTSGARSLRELLYDLLDLPEPVTPPRLVAWPAPRPEHRPAEAFDVHTTVTGSEVYVRRYPAAVSQHRLREDDTVRHLCAYESEWDLRILESASVLARRDLASRPEARVWVADALRRHPGASLAAAPVAGGSVLRFRDGDEAHMATPDAFDPMLSAAAVLALRRAGRLRSGDVTVRTGDRSTPLKLTLNEEPEPPGSS